MDNTLQDESAVLSIRVFIILIAQYFKYLRSRSKELTSPPNCATLVQGYENLTSPALSAPSIIRQSNLRQVNSSDIDITKKTIYKYKNQTIFNYKKGAIFWITPFYLFLFTTCFEVLLHVPEIIYY
jgi:hypothetical protein